MEDVCRVCLAGDRNIYRVANTALEQTYDVITGVKLQRAGRPTALCCVCVSQLRRCRRFIETARESNAALDRWYRDHIHTDSKPTERLLFSFIKTTPECVNIWGKPQVKQEPLETEDAGQNNVGANFTEYIKHEVTRGDIKSDHTHVSHEDGDSTQMSDDGQDNTQLSDDDDDENENRKCGGIKRKISNGVEWVNVQAFIDVEEDKALDDIKLEIPDVLDDVRSETSPGTSNVGNDHSSADQHITLRSLKSGKRIKLDEAMTNGPALERRRLITARHRPVNTGTASTARVQRNMFSCSQCTYTAPRQRDTIKHSNIQTTKMPFTYNKCDRKRNFKTHSMAQTGETQFACNKCNFKTIKKSQLKVHLMTHTCEYRFMCDKCGYKCRRIDRFKNHLLCHTGEMPFSCNKCDYKSTLKASLKNHLFTHSSEKPFACNKCDFKCILKSNLKRHLMTHTDEYPFTCDKCDYKTKRKCNLKQHLMTHTGEKPFECDQCDFKCSSKGDLKKHLLIHTGEKPFVCDKCDYKCNRKENLNKHLKSHTGEMPLTCDKCDYKSTSKRNLKIHLTIHTGKKLHACNKCDYKCIVRRNLKRHLKIHTGDKNNLTKNLKPILKSEK